MTKSRSILEWTEAIETQTQSGSPSANYSSQDFCTGESGGSDHPTGQCQKYINIAKEFIERNDSRKLFFGKL